MTGMALEETTSARATPAIRVGLREDLRDSTLPAPKPGFDGYSIVVARDHITLAGDNQRGALYAAYDLLERAGCRWWQPTLDPKDPEVVPRVSELSFAAGEWSESARVELRLYNGGAFFFWIHAEKVLPSIDWAAKNRYNFVAWQPSHEPGSLEGDMEKIRDCGAFDEMEKRGLALQGPCHSFPHFLPVDKYFKDHPDWFGMVNGKRRPYTSEWPLLNACWSNEEGDAEFLRNVVDFARRWPQIEILNVEWIDGGIVCQCPKCMERGGPNLIVDLFNRLSDMLEKEAPWTQLELVTGYGPLEAPPAGAIPNGKWGAVYAHWGRNHRTSYNDLEYSRRPNLLVWGSYFPRFVVCSYYAAASHQPFNSPPFLHALEGDLQFILDRKFPGHFVLEYPHGFWWNFAFNLGEAGKYAYYYPNRAPVDELRDYAMTYFGPKAGSLVTEYLMMFAANENLDISYRASRGEATDGDVEWLRTMEELRKRAVALAGDDPVVSYRLGKLGAAPQFFLEWGPSRRKVTDADQAFKDFQEGKAAADEVRKRIKNARELSDQLKTKAEAIEAAYPGAMTAEWFAGWYLDRLFKGPLDGLEKKLAAAENPATPQPSPTAPPQ